MTQILLSYNEVQSLARKAARGAGLPQGVADEIGSAALWLSARGVDALGIVVATVDGDPRSSQAILAGQVAIDALCCGETERISLQNRTEGLLLIGLAGAAAMDTRLNFALECANGDVVPLASLPDVCSLMSDITALRRLPDGGASVCPGTPRPAATDAAAYAAALGLAARTYVPASEFSRARGAGAGTTDND